MSAPRPLPDNCGSTCIAGKDFTTLDEFKRISIEQRFSCILTHHIAQCIGLPSSLLK